MIRTENLNHHVDTQDGGLQILADINMEVGQGDSAAIIGASGSGKSTLLGIIAGLDVPSSGAVLIDDTDIAQLSEEARADIRQRYVAFVFQNFQLLASLNALENVALPLEVKGNKQATDKAHHYLERVGLASRARHMPAQLSGGEQQRVALARAFACEAPIIFADEPTGNLDTQTGEQITQLLFDLNREEGKTLVVVTHSSALADRCNRGFTMSGGRLSEQV